MKWLVSKMNVNDKANSVCRQYIRYKVYAGKLAGLCYLRISLRKGPLLSAKRISG